jgi:DNA (cytosine-5)-methyltransferase 1
MRIKFIDLFAGIGGFRIALESSGAECVFTSEINPFAQTTYAANFSGKISGDITKIKEKDIPSHDVLCAGFPCQSFSTCGNGLGFSDPRGTMFFEIFRIAKYHKPKVIFLENVKGLLTHNEGDTFNTIKNSLSELGYTIYSQVLCATMFGVPQTRNRIYIIAIRNDILNNFQFPIGKLTNKKLKDIVEKNVDAKYFLTEERNNTICNNRILKRGGFGYSLIKPNDYVHTLLASKYEFNLIVDNTKPINLELRATDINKEKVRRLTPKEYARLQGYPEGYKVPVSNKQAYQLFGNSVAVPVIKAIFDEIKKIL